MTTVDYCGGSMGGLEAHGTAVAEIVHEMAPAAELYLDLRRHRGRPRAGGGLRARARHHDRQPLGWLVQQLARRRQRRGRNAGRNRGGGQRRRHPLGQRGRERRAGALERHVLGSGRQRLPQLHRHRRRQLDRSLPGRGDLRLPEVGCLADDTAGLRPLPRQRRRRRAVADSENDQQGETADADRGSLLREHSAATQNLSFEIARWRRPRRRGSISSSRSAARSSTGTQPAASSSPPHRRVRSPSAPSPGATTSWSPTAPSAPRSTAA